LGALFHSSKYSKGEGVDKDYKESMKWFLLLFVLIKDYKNHEKGVVGRTFLKL